MNENALAFAGRAGGAFLAYRYFGNKIHPALAAALGWLAAGIVIDATTPKVRLQ